MLDIKINNYFYDYVLDFIATKTEFKETAPKKK